MPSPFPGMDPYLEMRWGDVRARLVVYAADALAPQLPDDLAAQIASERYPDTSSSEPFTDHSIEIRAAEGDRLVTAIEVVNPWNRLTSSGRTAYRRRRARAVYHGANVVEVELVRAGESVTLAADHELPAGARSTSRICAICAGESRKRQLLLWPARLEQRIPVVAVPLRAGEADVVLDLQPSLDKAYENGRHRRVDYRKACDPPLTGAEAEWADALLRSTGRR